MPRRSRKPSPARPAAESPPLRGGWLRDEGGWIVRSISGTAATKTYVCPGCHQDIPPGTPHVVAWPADESEGTGPHDAERSRGGAGTERRHWHTGCWRREHGQG